MFRSTSLRLAAAYTVLFALCVVALGAVTLYSTNQTLAAQFDARVAAESAAMVREYGSEGLDGVVQAVRERDGAVGSLHFGVQDPDGHPVTGRLAVVSAPVGWSVVHRPARDGEEKLRVLVVDLPDGHRILVGDENEKIEVLEKTVLRNFRWALVGVVLLGVAGGYGLSRGVHRRLGAISGTAEAIIDGDPDRRIPVQGSDDDLDRLAATLNRMLDRNASLMESLRHVSNDVAHDLRTPLTRLRQRLEASLDAPGERREAIEGSLADLDGILETFAALLRISQIEGRARRSAFRGCDLAFIAATVVDDFAPSAEEQRQTMCFASEGPLLVQGDRELLTQMLVNLVENALRHAGPGANIAVRTGVNAAGRPVLSVVDDGPGIPAGEELRVFDRFYRLEHSRSTPGSGLGLALSLAVARLHGADIVLSNAEPGLRADVVFG